jgi:hypothetical protein
MSIAMEEGSSLTTSNGPGYALKFVMYEGGELVNGDSASYCDVSLVGNEFAPLAEIENGVENPYSDETRGRIDVSEPADALADVDFKQNKYLGNILGADSILGRSIFIYESTDDTSEPREFELDPDAGGFPSGGCCVIARMAPPTTMVSNVTWVRQNTAPHHHHYNTYSQQPKKPSYSPYGTYGHH